MRKWIIAITVIFIVIVALFSCCSDYRRNVTFFCSRYDNICTYSSLNLFRVKTVKTFELDKILKSNITENVSAKTPLRRYARSLPCYTYDWVIFYDNNGVENTFNVFRTREYVSSQAFYNLDDEYRYYVDMNAHFNSFLKDKSQQKIYMPEYKANIEKEIDFWKNIFRYSITVMQVLAIIFMVIGLFVVFWPDNKSTK